jgi:hypothetical protein
MNTKQIPYGTEYSVSVLAAEKLALTLVDEINNEGYILAYHGLDPLPAVGDKGTIVFEKNNGPAKGHWQYYPNKK